MSQYDGERVILITEVEKQNQHLHTWSRREMILTETQLIVHKIDHHSHEHKYPLVILSCRYEIGSKFLISLEGQSRTHCFRASTVEEAERNADLITDTKELCELRCKTDFLQISSSLNEQKYVEDWLEHSTWLTKKEILFCHKAENLRRVALSAIECAEIVFLEQKRDYEVGAHKVMDDERAILLKLGDNRFLYIRAGHRAARNLESKSVLEDWCSSIINAMKEMDMTKYRSPNDKTIQQSRSIQSNIATIETTHRVSVATKNVDMSPPPPCPTEDPYGYDSNLFKLDDVLLNELRKIESVPISQRHPASNRLDNNLLRILKAEDALTKTKLVLLKKKMQVENYKAESKAQRQMWRRLNKATQLKDEISGAATNMVQTLRAFQRIRNFEGFYNFSCLGVGSSGMVLKCSPKDPEVRALAPYIALKILFNYHQQGSKAVAYILRSEYKVLAAISPHRNIVALLGAIGPSPLTPELSRFAPPDLRCLFERTNIKTKETRYTSTLGIVLEYLPMSLLDHLKIRGTKISAREILGICAQILRAVLHLQRHRVVHLDLKLDNVLVSPTGGRVVLTDFGTAQQLQKYDGIDPSSPESWMLHIRADQTPTGNLAHRAPEALEAQNSLNIKVNDSNTSLIHIPMKKQPEWACGVLLFEISTGEHPYGDYPVSGTSVSVLQSETQQNYIDEQLNIVKSTVSSCFSSTVRELIMVDPQNRTSIQHSLTNLERDLANMVAASKFYKTTNRSARTS